MTYMCDYIHYKEVKAKLLKINDIVLIDEDNYRVIGLKRTGLFTMQIMLNPVNTINRHGEIEIIRAQYCNRNVYYKVVEDRII